MLLRPIRVRAKFNEFHISAPGYAKNPAGFIPKPSSRLFQRRMQYAPTRVHEKFGGFHISAPGYAKNAPGFRRKPSAQDILGRMQYAPTRVREKTCPVSHFPNRDTPKPRPVLAANSCRRTFRGVCNTPLHGYVKNLAGFIFPHPNTSKTHPISPIPIGICPKPARF